MADENLNSDMSGRPVPGLTVAELAAVKVPEQSPFDVEVVMPDGSRLIDAGDGKYYPAKEGWPDWDNPVSRSEVERRWAEATPG